MDNTVRKIEINPRDSNRRSAPKKVYAVIKRIGTHNGFLQVVEELHWEEEDALKAAASVKEVETKKGFDSVETEVTPYWIK
jgi:hypothetical protein